MNSTASDSVLPNVRIKFSVSSDTYHRSVKEEKDLVQLKVEAVLDYPWPITIDLRGQFAAETVLEDTFRFQHFEWFDLTTGEILKLKEFENFCNPRVTLEARQTVTLEPGKPLIATQYFDEMSPLCDPLMATKVGHQYRLRLKTQEAWWIDQTKEELFKEHKVLRTDDLPQPTLVQLVSDDEVKVQVEE